jgi:hypothetical protein
VRAQNTARTQKGADVPIEEEKISAIEAQLAKIAERQKATARAVADLALGLNTEAIAHRDRHAETQGLILGMIAELRHEPKRERRNSEDTQDFPLPGGSDGEHVRLSKRTQRKILRWVLVGTLFALTHVAHFFIQIWKATHH